MSTNSKASNYFFVSLVSGGCAGTATDLTFFPIDTLKTRLQASGGFFNNGGFRGLYKGLGSALVGSAPSASLFFITYDTMKRYLYRVLPSHFSKESTALTVAHMISSSMGEIAACTVRVPVEVIKQRTQSMQFKTSWKSFKFIAGNKSGEGILKGLYRGYGSTIMREIPFTTIEFPLYEALKAEWAEKTNVKYLSPGKDAVCGSIAGGIAAAITTPLDVLKTRLMLEKQRVPIFKMISRMVQNEGYSIFLSGIVPRTMWISAGGAVFLGAYETVSASLRTLYELD